MAARLLLGFVLLAAAALGGCGGEDAGDQGAAPARAVPWLDSEGEAPIVGALGVDPADGALWMATNTGLFRLPDGARRPERVTGTLDTGDGSGRVSAQLVVRFTGPGRLLASGHPAAEEADLPAELGLIASRDAGRTWTSVSGLGTLDFHAIEQFGNTVIGSLFDGARVLVSRDGGRTFPTERVTPRVVTGFAADPGDPRRWIASAEDGIYATTDEGASWRPVDAVPYSRFAWAASDELYRLDPGGPVKRSADGGRSWEDRGSTGGEPEALAAAGQERLYAALADGTVKRSDDGGRTWRAVLAPPR
jgi:hypothetical protein